MARATATTTRRTTTRARSAGTRRRRAPRPRTAEQIARTNDGPRPLPDLTPTRAVRTPSTVERDGDNGLAITAVRRAATPMVELRLRIPFAATGEGRAPQHAARAELLAETILLGTHRRDRETFDADLATVGGQLTAHVTPQRLLLSGSVLATGLDVLLDVVADCLTGAAYRTADVARERDRLTEQLTIANSQPSTIARTYLQRRRFGAHPAAWEMPDAGDVAGITPVALRSLHRRSVLPDGSSLILVGDLRPARAAEQAERALESWTGSRAARTLTAVPAPQAGPPLVFHRPGAVQSQIRLTAPGVARADPDYPAAQIANIVLGGYFSSRLVENLREDKGFTYHASSTPEFWPDRSLVTIGYDTAVEATAASLVEAQYELARITTAPPTDSEIEAARNYAIGSLASSLASQAGYASMLSGLAGSGLGGEWLREHSRRLASVDDDAVAAAATRLFAPDASAGIIVTDADVTGAALARLGCLDGE